MSKNIESLLSPYIKCNLKYTKDIHIKLKTKKLQEGIIEEDLVIGFDNDFLGNKEKIG